jgi:hypothetical protein
MKHIIRKILKEQKEVINVPDIHDFFDGDWNEILRFTKGKKFRIYNDINLGRVCPDNLNRIISIHGDLLISHCDNLKTLGDLERIDGVANIQECENLESLGKLERVGYWLDLNLCYRLKSLDNLKYVGYWLNLRYCMGLESLGDLEYVGGDLTLADCQNLKSLGNLKYVGGDLDLTNCISLTQFENQVEVKGNVFIRIGKFGMNSYGEELEKIFKVGGKIKLR